MAFEWPAPGASAPAVPALAAARLGLNLVVIDAPFVLDDEPPAAAWESLRGEVELLRRLGLEAVVVARCLGSAREMLQRCPEGAAARWAFGEKHELKGDDPVFLAQPNVLRSGATSPEVLTLSGERCAEGTDYVLIPGATQYPFSASSAGG
jgi:hypothetical protein